MKAVLVLLSSDRFSFPLIHYLASEGKKQRWKISVASMFDNTILSRLKKDEVCKGITFLTITDFTQCEQAIKKTDLVISLITDTLLLKVADSCLLYGKALIAPSRLNRQIMLRKSQAEENDCLLLLECGFAPGLDHITAKKAIDNIHSKGGTVSSFKTYNGSFIEDGYANNPWGFKLTEPASDIINTGKQNNRHLINHQVQHIPYHRLFERGESISIQGLNNVVSVPEGDSFYYRKIYQLDESHTVIKGKIYQHGFDRIWGLLIKLGLTEVALRIDPTNMSFYQFMHSLFPYAPSESIEVKLKKYIGAENDDIEKLRWLGLFNEEWIEKSKELSAAAVLHYLLEKNFSMQENDIDRVAMQHQLFYEYRNMKYKLVATLLANGESSQHSALAKTIGLTLGAAAKSYLQGSIAIKGLQLPTKKEIYDPILNELYELGVTFHIEEKRIYEDDSSLDETINNSLINNLQ